MKRQRQRRGPSSRRASAAASAAARATIIAFNRVRHLHPTCTATAKSTGEQCRRFAMANGKCDMHGGKTGKGRRWQMPLPINPNRSDAAERTARKLQDFDRAARKRARRIAKMTDDERAAYDAWKRSHRPGDPKRRAVDRERRRRDREARELLKRLREDPPLAAAPELDVTVRKAGAEIHPIGDVFA